MAIKKRGDDGMKMIITEEQRAGKRWNWKKCSKKIPFSSRKMISSTLGKSPKVVGKKLRRPQTRLQVGLLKAKLTMLKGEIKDSAESLKASKVEAEQAESMLEGLIVTRNLLKDNLLEMKATEAFLMLELGFL